MARPCARENRRFKTIRTLVPAVAAERGGEKSEKTLEARDGTCAQEKQRGCANRDLFIAAHETGARQNAVETARENKEPGRERQAARGNESAGGHRGFRDLRFIHHGT